MHLLMYRLFFADVCRLPLVVSVAGPFLRGRVANPTSNPPPFSTGLGTGFGGFGCTTYSRKNDSPQNDKNKTYSCSLGDIWKKVWYKNLWKWSHCRVAAENKSTIRHSSLSKLPPASPVTQASTIVGFISCSHEKLHWYDVRDWVTFKLVVVVH